MQRKYHVIHLPYAYRWWKIQQQPPNFILLDGVSYINPSILLGPQLIKVKGIINNQNRRDYYYLALAFESMLQSENSTFRKGCKSAEGSGSAPTFSMQ